MPLAIASVLVLLAALGFLAQSVYALWLHAVDPCKEYIYVCRDKLHFFGSEQSEVIGAFALTGVTVAVGLLYVVNVLVVCVPPSVRACRTGSRILRGLAVELLVRVERRAHMLFVHPASDDDDDSERMQREFVKNRLRRVRSMVHFCLPLFITATLWICWSFHLGKTLLRSSQDPLQSQIREVHWMFLFGSGGVPLLALIVPGMYIELYPSHLTSHLLDCWNALCASAWAWKLSVAYDDAYPFHHHWLMATRLLHCFCMGNARWSTVLNVGLFAIEVANCFVREETSNSRSNVMLRDCLMCIAISWVTYALEQAHWLEVRLLVRTRKSNQSMALVRQLLDHVCDALPLLDAQLCFVKPCPGLAALLLRGGPIPQGAPFLDFVVPEDAGRLRACLAGPQPALPPPEAAPGQGEPPPPAGAAATGTAAAFAGLCHVHLRAVGGQLPTSVLYSCITDEDGVPNFLLGIREEHPEGGVPDLAPSQLSDGLAVQLSALPEMATVGAEDRSSSAWSSVSDKEDTEALAVWVDAGNPQLSVLGSSSAFALLGGSTGACSTLSEWMNMGFMRKIWCMLDNLGNPRNAKVKLTPPGGVHYLCTVQMSLFDAAEAPAFVEEAMASARRPVRLDFKMKKKTSMGKSLHLDREVVKANLEAAASRAVGRMAAATGHCGSREAALQLLKGGSNFQSL